MKKLFSILLVLCAAFAYADDQPTFEETDDTECSNCMVMAFAATEPVFEDADEVSSSTCDDCGDECKGECRDECKEEGSETVNENCLVDEDESCLIDEDGKDVNAFLPHGRLFGASQEEENELEASYTRWTRYESTFDNEKINIRFPSKPAASKSSTLFTAYAYDHAVLYSFAGYYPTYSPLRNYSAIDWFEQILDSASDYPYTLVSHAIYQLSGNDWILDYVMHDYVQNLIIKTRSYITAFNSYTIQCVKPAGTRDHFEYFVENFSIKCNCCR